MPNIPAHREILTKLDQNSSVALPPEALEALGVQVGAELEVEIVGRALVIRSVEKARRRSAYEELTRDPD